MDFLHNAKAFTLFHPSTVIKQVTVSSGTEVGFCPTRTIEFCAIFISHFVIITVDVQGILTNDASLY